MGQKKVTQLLSSALSQLHSIWPVTSISGDKSRDTSEFFFPTDQLCQLEDFYFLLHFNKTMNFLTWKKS